MRVRFFCALKRARMLRIQIRCLLFCAKHTTQLIFNFEYGRRYI